MSKFLKGNYKVKEDKGKESSKEEDAFSKMFESKAMEKLGGSIAFVMKGDKFIWDGDDEKTK
jgi:hypothetical protein|tara:strand:+ start:1416 stop:1601 length:186 start_codon:yes stop_codon:yes gene_type:complete